MSQGTAWYVVDRNGEGALFEVEPTRLDLQGVWAPRQRSAHWPWWIDPPKQIRWEDDPVKVKISVELMAQP